MDWKECCNKRISKEVHTDEMLKLSLIKSSNNKLQSSEQLTLTETTAASKLSLTYDSLRELLESIALKNGYKIYNHECYTAFLKEILNESQRADQFDDLRKARNAVNYYGKEISIEECRILITKIKELRTYLDHKQNST